MPSIRWYCVRGNIIYFGKKKCFIKESEEIKVERCKIYIQARGESQRQGIWNAMERISASIRIRKHYHTKCNLWENYILIYYKEQLVASIKDFGAIERTRLNRLVAMEEKEEPPRQEKKKTIYRCKGDKIADTLSKEKEDTRYIEIARMCRDNAKPSTSKFEEEGLG